MSEDGILEADDSRLNEAHIRASRLVEHACHQIAPIDGPVDIIVETGEPVDTILSYIDSTDVDHIVMGSNEGSTTGPLHHLFKTVATTVASKAPIPVTIIR